MVARRVSNSGQSETRRPLATTPDEREIQLIEAAVDLAEKQLRDGSASAQVITHYLKLGSSRERLEQERLKGEVTLMRTKQQLMESEKRTEQLMIDALNAMRGYTGAENVDQEPVYDEYED